MNVFEWLRAHNYGYIRMTSPTVLEGHCRILWVEEGLIAFRLNDRDYVTAISNVLLTKGR